MHLESLESTQEARVALGSAGLVRRSQVTGHKSQVTGNWYSILYFNDFKTLKQTKLIEYPFSQHNNSRTTCIDLKNEFSLNG